MYIIDPIYEICVKRLIYFSRREAVNLKKNITNIREFRNAFDTLDDHRLPQAL